MTRAHHKTVSIVETAYSYIYYSYQIQIICMQLYGFKYSYLFIIICLHSYVVLSINNTKISKQLFGPYNNNNRYYHSGSEWTWE